MIFLYFLQKFVQEGRYFVRHPPDPNQRLPDRFEEDESRGNRRRRDPMHPGKSHF